MSTRPDTAVRQTDTAGLAALEQRAEAGTRTRRELDGETADVWRCQATEALTATPLKVSDLRQYGGS